MLLTPCRCFTLDYAIISRALRHAHAATTMPPLLYASDSAMPLRDDTRSFRDARRAMPCALRDIHATCRHARHADTKSAMRRY